MGYMVNNSRVSIYWKVTLGDSVTFDYRWTLGCRVTPDYKVTMN